MDNARIAERMTERLGLDLPPVALALLDAPPEGVAVVEDQVPSSCALWRRAEKGVFYAPAAAHFNCALGSMVMGFELPEKIRSDLQGQVELMLGAKYIGEDEPARVPTMPRQSRGVLYGPLKDFPVAPDLILTWLTPVQAMLFNETEGDVRWASNGLPKVLGRPGCAALPTAMREGKSSLTFGCMGMRTYTEIGGDRMLMVLPGARAEVFADQADSTDLANDAMRAYYQEAKAHYES